MYALELKQVCVTATARLQETNGHSLSTKIISMILTTPGKGYFVALFWLR